MSSQWLVGSLILAPLVSLSGATRERVLQTNAAGDNVHVIDPATNKVVGTINDIEVPHGVVISPDGGRIYVTQEPTKTPCPARW
jgi:YVTN family beta-propeller protein